MFGTAGIAETTLGIKEGINVVTIARWEAGENANQKAFISVFLYPKGGDPEKAREFRFFISTEKGMQISMKKIVHICTKMVKREALDAVQAPNAAAYAAALTQLTAGKDVRIVFDGEEYYKDGKLRIAAKLDRLGDFAEAVISGAEYPAVSSENTRLVFDPTKHIKKTPNPDVDGGTPPLPDSDLPF